MKSMSSNTKRLALVGGLIMIVVYLMVWRPRAGDLSDARSERDAMVQELLALKAATGPGAAPTTAAPAVSVLTAGIPSTPDLANLLRQLQVVATDTGVVQGIVSPAPNQANINSPGGSIGVVISVSGPKPAVYEYVRRLGGLERLFVVDKFSVAPNAGAGAATDLTATAAVPTDGLQLDISGRAFTSAVPGSAGATNG